MTEVVLNVANMKCAGCVATVEQALTSLEGVESVTVSLEDKKATVTGSADPAILAQAVTDAGFPAEVSG